MKITEAVKELQELFARLSLAVGGGRNPYLFTKQDSSAKLVHNGDVTDEYEQIVLYLPQANRGRALYDKYWTPELQALVDEWSAEYGNPRLHASMCTHSTPGCRAACLGNAGRLSKPSSERALLARYLLLRMYPGAFWYMVCHEIGQHDRRVSKHGKRLVVRINGTSDIDIVDEPRVYLNGQSVLDVFPRILFQDYTKRPITASGYWIDYDNYYVVRSITERDGPDVFAKHVGNVVVPVNLPPGAPLPDRFMGRPVVDGDVHDLRCLDKQISGADRHAVLVRVKKRTDGVRADHHGFIWEVPA